MALPSKKGQIRIEIGGAQVSGSIDWPAKQMLATFDNGSSQANITTNHFEFAVNNKPDNGGKKILEHIANGLTGGVGIFEGPDFALKIHNKNTQFNAFQGFADLTDDFQNLINIDRVKFKVKKSNGLNTFNDKLKPLTYGFLEANGTFDVGEYTKIKYVAEKKINAFELLVSAVILYLMIKELAQAVRDLVDQIGTIAGIFASGISGFVGAAIYAIAIAAVQIIYVAILLAAILELGGKLIAALVPPQREAYVLNLGLALSKVVEFLGYKWATGVEDLATIYYLPSNIRVDDTDSDGFVSLPHLAHGPTSGIPNVTDLQYSVIEMFKLAADLFNGKYAVIGDTVHFRSENDPFWVKTSTWVPPSVEPHPFGYNTADFKASKLFSFATDGIMDEHTLDNFKGTVYGVSTGATSTIHPKNKTLKGLFNPTWNVCLGNRKDSLNALEKFLKGVAGSMDEIANFFGGNSNLAGKVQGKVGLLKISTNNWTLPKLIRLDDSGKLAPDHRNNWSAKYLYGKYHIENSFVANGWHGQKEIHTGITMPFGFEDFLQLIDNSYFYIFGRQAKVTKLVWTIEADTAVLDYWIRRPYTTNLVETFIEPD